MGAVKNQPGLSEPDRLTARYGGVPVIYVESEDDSYVFGDCWFKDWLAKLEFKPAATQCGGFAGCGAVIKAVRDERVAGNLAWGIVDRDTVMRDNLWHLVNETDDARYQLGQPYAPEVRALCRWELESYLADGDALEQCRAELKREAKRPIDLVIQELIIHCHSLVPHAAFNAACHLHSTAGLGVGSTNRFPTRDAVEADIAATQLPRLPVAAASDYAQQVSLVEAFDPVGAAPEDRIISMLRRIDGKALLQRFSAAHKIQVDLKGLLANRIKERARVPGELIALIREFAGT